MSEPCWPWAHDDEEVSTETVRNEAAEKLLNRIIKVQNGEILERLVEACKPYTVVKVKCKICDRVYHKKL